MFTKNVKHGMKQAHQTMAKKLHHSTHNAMQEMIFDLGDTGLFVEVGFAAW
jgi:hypothetical protein